MNNLAHRRVLTYSTCDLCHAASKTVIHALWECPELLAIWESVSQWNFHRIDSFSTFSELALHVIKERKDLEKFATIVRTIWYRRNQVRVSQKNFPYDQIFPMASHMLINFLQVLPDRQTQPSIAGGQQVRWHPPPTTKLKVNFDGAVFKENNKAGLVSKYKA